jgi:hypothetical protein
MAMHVLDGVTEAEVDAWWLWCFQVRECFYCASPLASSDGGLCTNCWETISVSQPSRA